MKASQRFSLSIKCSKSEVFLSLDSRFLRAKTSCIVKNHKVAGYNYNTANNYQLLEVASVATPH